MNFNKINMAQLYGAQLSGVPTVRGPAVRGPNFPGPNLPRILPKKDIKTLWLPLVVYTNTDQLETTRLRVDWEWSTKVVANRESNFERSGHEIEIKTKQIRK